MRLSLFRSFFGSAKQSTVRRKNPLNRVRLLIEALEDRVVPSATWTVKPGGGGDFTTISAAVAAPTTMNGDTILVDAGTYDELVSVNKSLTIEGAQHGVDARSRSGAESIVDGTLNGSNRTTSFYITANNVTIDGFTVRDQSDPNQFGAGIVMASGTSGVDILNNIVTNNAIGIYANSAGASLIQHNLFDGNNTPGPAGGTSIYSEFTNHLTVDGNKFINQTQNNPVIFAATAAGVHQNLQFTNNALDNSVVASAVYCVGISGGVFSGNSITTEGQATGIRLGGADSNITITGNNIYNVFRGVGVLDDGYGLGNNSNVAIHLNSITGVSGAGAVDVDASYASGSVDASGNWWGTAIGANPSDLTAPTAIDGLTSGPVTVGSFLDSGTNVAVGNGFVPAAATEMWVPKTKATSGLTRVDGNIQLGVDSALAGMTVRVAADTYAENVIISKSVDLKGAQAGQNANTRFAAFTTGANGPKADPTVETVLTAPTNNPLGGNPNADDLIRVLANNITIDGLVIDGNNPALGASTLTSNGVNIHARRGIQNSDANNNFVDVNNLLVENNIIQNIAQRGIELSNDATSSTGNLITANLIRNFGSDPVNGGLGIILFTNAYADVTNNTIVDTVGAGLATGLQLQNFYSNGTMTWSGNNITVAQDDIGIIANLFYASSATLNINNTVNAAAGVTATDGFTWGIYVLSVQVGSTVSLSGNMVGSSGGTFARGIDFWNLPTTATVSVSGGTVGNSSVGIELDSSDPNFGAGAATTVNVSNVTITGGTTGVQVEAAAVNAVDPTASVTANLTGVTISGATTGVLVQGFSASITATATLYRDTITGATTGVQVNANGNLGTLAQNTAQNFITGNTTGIAIASGAGTVQPIFDNNLSGNTTALSNSSSTTVDASGNWWGSNTRAGVQGTISGGVDYTPFLNSGTDTDLVTAGFQGDFSFLNVDSQSPQVGSTGRIQEGINLLADGSLTGAARTVNVLSGTYAENVVVNKSLKLIGANAGINPITGSRGAETIVEPGLASSFDTSSVILVTANNVTIDGLTVQGSIASPPLGQSTGFTLTSGTKVYAAAGISNSSNINTGGGSPSTTDISGLTVQNNIVQDFTQVGVYGDTSDGTPSTGNTIANNFITDIPNNGQGGYYGEGVIIYDNFYANVTLNKLTKVRTGIQTGNNYRSAGAFAPSISSNTVSAYVKGVYFNLQYASASTFTVSGNTITQADGTVSPAYNVGLLIQSIQSSVQSVITGNKVSGFLYGVEFAGNNTTNTVTLQGGTLNANTYGVWDTNNDYFYPANYDTTAVVNGVTITNSTAAGIWVDSTSANSASQFDIVDTVALTVQGNTAISGSLTGILVAGSLSSAVITKNAATITGNTIGIDVNAGSASVQQNSITANGTGISVENGGSLTSVTQNFITNNTGDGILIKSTAGAIAHIYDNDLHGNGGFAVDNQASPLVDATGNWWGSNLKAGVAAKVNGNVNFTGWLGTGTDTQPATPGFQGDFSPLITSTNHATFIVGQSGPAFTVTTAGDPVPSLSIPAGSLPSGLSFLDNGDGTATISGTPAVGTDGVYTFTITAHNGAGADATQVFTLTVSLTPGSAQLLQDPFNPSQNALVIVGTNNNDDIEVERDDHSSKVEVEIDSRHFDLEKSFAISSFDRIIIYGLNGNDDIEVSNNVVAPAVIFTGPGNNEVDAGGGPTIVVGGGGNNHFEGGKGNAILIGGAGKSHLEAGRGNDILIAGTTAYDHNLIALCQIMSVWQTTTNANYNSQVSLLQAGTYKLDATTVHSNAEGNHLDGSDSARDWFFANLDGIGNNGVKDKISDLRSNEVVTHITL